MASFYLEQGLVIRRHGETLEYVSQCGEELYFESPENRRRESIPKTTFWADHLAGNITIIQAFSSPKQLILPDTPNRPISMALMDAPKRYQDEARRRLHFINKLHKTGITIGQSKLIALEVKRIAEELGDNKPTPSVSTVCRWWRNYQRSNFDVSAVVSRNAKRRSPVRFDEASERFLNDSIEALYLTRERVGKLSTYKSYKTALEAENRKRTELNLPLLRLASERTLYNRISALNKYDVMVARMGREAARKSFNMIKGHLPASYPLDAVEIDHSPMNLFVLDDLAYLPLGRPWLTAIKDRFSKILLGFYISFQATGLGSIFGAIKHSLHSHHRAYQHWPDLENPWPAFGRGAVYVSDRGADFLSTRYELAITSLGAEYERCQVRTPWLKASVERFFLTLEQNFFETMPGKTFANLQARGDYNPAKDAVIKFSVLIYLIHKWAVDFHNIARHSRTHASPLELWNEGIGTAPPPYPANVDELNIILGEHHEGAALSHEGIRFLGLNYVCDELNELRKRIGLKKTVDYAVSREDIGHIHVKNPLNGEYFKATCTRPDYAAGLSLYQHKYLRKQARLTTQNPSHIDTLVQTRLLIASTIAEAIENKSNATKVRLARVAGINSNAVLEGKRQSILTPFDGQSLGYQPPSPAADEVSITNIPSYMWGV